MGNAVETVAAMRLRAERLLLSLADGGGDADAVATLWREIVNREEDPTRRAEAILNLAAALALTDDEGLEQAIAMTDRALQSLGSKHPGAFGAYLMSAQRLRRRNGSRPLPSDLRKALEYLHGALVVSTTIGNWDALAKLITSYAAVARQVGDFTELKRARHVFDRLRKHGVNVDEFASVYGAMIDLYASLWENGAHRLSLDRGVILSSEVLNLIETSDSMVPASQIASLYQQRAVLLLDRHRHSGTQRDFDEAVGLFRSACRLSGDQPAMLNSLALALMGPEGSVCDDARFNEARNAIDQGLAGATTTISEAYLRWSSGNWHLQAYSRGGPVRHIECAVTEIEAAAQHRSITGDKVLFSLAHAYHERFRVTHEQSHIDQAVETSELGLTLVPENGAERWKQEVTTANAHQERALNGLFSFDEHDAERANVLFQAALARVPRTSAVRSDIAGGALGAFIDRYLVNHEDRILQAAAKIARMLSDDLQYTARLGSIASVNLAVFHILYSDGSTDRKQWFTLLKNLAAQQRDAEVGWLAASNLMHLNVGTDWHEVISSFRILERQRRRRLAAASGERERMMTLRREQNVAALAGLALVHMGKYEEAAAIIDQSQAALLDHQERADADANSFWSMYDAVLYPAVTRYGSYVVVLTENGATGCVLPQILEIEMPAEPGPPGPGVFSTASELIVAAFSSAFPQRLLIVPAGELAMVPWAAIPVEGQSLIDRACVTVLPTRSFWQAGRVPVTGNTLIVEAPDAMPQSPLQYVASETQQVRKWFPEGIDLRDKSATTAATIAAIPNANILHFACHGIADLDRPTRSRLILHDDQGLSVSDILAIDCSNARLVVLSACRSAVHGVGLPDEFGSMAMAFLAAGAHWSVGTLWNVSDVAASLFSRHFFDLVRLGESPRACVRAAQLWLRDSTNVEKASWLDGIGEPVSPDDQKLRESLRANGSHRSFGDPKYWAAFVCYVP